MAEETGIPRLSICIATRNRAQMLQHTLDSFVAQVAEGIEIVVLDGASSDGTAELLSDYASRFRFIRFVRKSANGGVDRDYDEAVINATGRYCWLMSDDDIPLDGAVDLILEKLRDLPSLLILNAELRNLDMSKVLDGNRLGWDSDRLYGPDDFARLFKDTSAYLSYIGAVVISRELWLSRRRTEYFGSCFIHVGVIFQARLPGNAVACARPVIAIRFGNTQWRPREFEIRMFLWTDLIWSFTDIAERERADIYPRRPWCSLKSLFFYRAKGTYGLTEYRKHIPGRTTFGFCRMQALLVAVFPGVLANIIGLLVCRMPYRDSNIHFLDMQASRFYFPNWIDNARAGRWSQPGKQEKP